LELNLGIGENKVLGSNAIGDIAGDSDRFMVVVPDHTELSAVTYSFSNVQHQGIVHNVRVRYRLRDLGYSFFTPIEEFKIIESTWDADTGYWAIGASPVSLFSVPLPLGQGSLVWDPTGTGWSGTSGTDDQVYWDYEISFMVQRISEGTASAPTTIALMGLGLAGIGWRRKRVSRSINSVI